MCAFYLNLRRTISDQYVQNYKHQSDNREYGKHPKQHSSKEGDKEDMRNKVNMFPYIHKQLTRSASVHLEQKKIQMPKSESSDVKNLRAKLQKAQQAYQQQALQINQTLAEIRLLDKKLQAAVAMDNKDHIGMYRQRISEKEKRCQIYYREKKDLRGEIRYLTERLDNLKKLKRC